MLMLLALPPSAFLLEAQADSGNGRGWGSRSRIACCDREVGGNRFNKAGEGEEEGEEEERGGFEAQAF